MNKPAPLSSNQIEYWKRANYSWLNVAEGGKRGGKNVLQTLIYCAILENHPDKLHLIAGVSTATAKLNIADCDGYGIYNFFEGRCKDGKYKNRDCIYVNTKTGLKVILVSGGGKEGDLRYIKGNTYGTVYITESNECAPSFIKEAFDRTVSSKNRKIMLDLNPKAPNNWFYTDVLAFHEEQQKKNPNYGYNYGHFTIADNFSISDERLRQILSTYDKNSIWYKRDIKGQRVSADGLCFQQFADDPNRYLIDTYEKQYIQIRLGVDFGGNGSQHAFIATAITPNMKEVVVVKSQIVKAKGVTPIELYKAFCDFARLIHATYNRAMVCYCDSAEQTLINGMRKEVANQRLPIEIRNAMKREIVDRIRLTNTLLAQDRIKLLKNNTKSLQEALSTAVWDSKASEQGVDIRLDDGTSDIDSLDAFEYTIESEMKNLINCG